MKLSISIRLVLLVALLVTATASTISYYLYKSSTGVLVENALQELSLNLRRDGDQLASHIEELKRDVLFLADSPPIPDLIRAQQHGESGPSAQQRPQQLARLFTTMLSTNPGYYQVRLLDAKGRELVKTGRDKNNVIVFPGRALQDKSRTAYFQAAIKLPRGQTYISPVNLNREYGKISLPHTPVIRCATPVYHQGKLFGIVVINLDFSYQLARLEKVYATEEQTLFVTNSQGAYLSHPDPAKRFAFELGHQYRIQEDFPQLADLFAPANRELYRNSVPQDPDGKILVFVKIPLDENTPERFVAVGLHRAYAQVVNREAKIQARSLGIITLLILLSIFFAFGFASLIVRPLKQIANNLENFSSGSRPSLPVKRTDEIGVLARALDTMADNVFSSHQALRTLNTHLEDEVEARTKEVRQHLHLVNTINQAQTSFISSPEPQLAFQYLLDNLVELTGSGNGFIAEVRYQDDGTPYTKTYAFSGVAKDDDFYKHYRDDVKHGLELYNLQNLFGAVLTNGAPVFCNDPANDARSAGTPSGHPAINSFAGLPIYIGDTLIGLAALANRPEGYHEDIISLIQPYLATFANLIDSLKTRQAARQKELELQQTRAELERVISVSPVVFYTARAEGDFGATFISPNIQQQLGYSPHEFIDDPGFWAEHIHPEDRDRVFAVVDELFKTGCHSHTYRFRHKNGDYRWMQDELQVITDKQGKATELVGYWLDVTERKKIQDELSRFKTTLDQTQDCVFMFHPDTLNYFYVNQGAMYLVGYSQEELSRLHPYDINIQHKDEASFRKFVAPLVDGVQTSIIFETEYRTRRQSLVPVEVIMQYIVPESESPRFVAMVRDITERKKIDRMKNEFVSTVSHELRTPLTSIRGSLGLLTGGAVTELPKQMQQMLQIASNNTERLLLLINDILDIQKIESGQMTFRFKPINVMDLLDQAVRDNSAYAEQYNVSFVISHHKAQVHVLGDHDRLVQVLNNLMSNAVKFSPAGGSVELAVAQHGDAIRISVTDHGQGIPEDFQPRLFEQFTQSDASDSRQKGGTGLGLSIVKAIIDKHGGRLDYITRQGLGTTMLIELPVCKPSQQEELDTPHTRLGKHNPCILILEDDADIAMLLKRLLSGAGYNCDIAQTAAEARRLLQTNITHYKAMTLDIQLPDVDGVSFINELRNNPQTQSLPVIVVSVEADAARHRLNGGAVGIVDWLDKPIDEQRLIHAIGTACQTAAIPRLLHIEDEADVVQIVKTLLQDKAKLSWAKNLQDARDMLNRDHFELVLLDIALPDGSGLSLLSEIEQQHPASKLVIYSAHELAPDFMRQVHAVLSKSSTDNEKLLHTIESLLVTI